MLCIREFYVFFIMVVIVLVSACAQDNDSNSSQKDQASQESKTTEETDQGIEKKVIASNLQEPWEIEQVDSSLYISERTGSIVKVEAGEVNRKPVQFDASLSQQAEAGLLGLAFPENFSQTNTAIAYYSYEQNGAYYQRVVTVEETEEQWREKSILLDKIPGGEFHQGGRMEIGPDNKLYITTGDATNPESAQDMESLAGKILRMNLDGTVPNDNPQQDSYVFSYGHRNPQGLAWGKGSQLYATEHGSSATDEINQIEAGNNYGWPEIQGDETKEGMKTPIIHSGEDTWAPSGMTYLHGKFYFASLRGEALRQFDPLKETETAIISDVGRVRDVMADQNGLYIITNNTDGRGNPAENDDQLMYIPIPKNQLHQ